MIFTVAMYRAQHDTTVLDRWLDLNLRGWRGQAVTLIETLPDDDAHVDVTRAHVPLYHWYGLCPDGFDHEVEGRIEVDPRHLCQVKHRQPVATRFPVEALDADALAAVE